MVVKGFTIGLVCLVLGGVIGFKAKYFEVEKQIETAIQVKKMYNIK